MLALSSIACAVLLAGCGGGSGGAAGGTASTLLTGTAAKGLAIVGGSVVAIDANGKLFPAGLPTSATGAYTVDVATGVAPFILTITGLSNGQIVKMSSIATAPGTTVNITPLTDLIVSTSAGQPGGATLVDLCSSAVTADKLACKNAVVAAGNTTNLNAAITGVTGLIAATATAVGAASPNLLNGPLVGGSHSGMDALLDAVLVTPATTQTGGGAMATVTLINAANTVLGTVPMPATAGGVAPAITKNFVLPAMITQAATGVTALAEINACMASFGALFPANMTVAPTAAQVTPFVDATFSMGGPGSTFNQAVFITEMSTLASAGTGGLAMPGGSISKVLGLSSFDFTPQATASALLTTASPVSTNAAWVRLDASQSGGGTMNMKMIKGAAYPGCAAGWKIAGEGHVQMHMNARVKKNSFNGVTTYTRELPFHVQTADATAEGIGSITFTGPGLNVYSGTTAAPVGAPTPLTLVVPAVPPAVGAIQLSWLGISGQMNVADTNASNTFYGNAEAIQSCQDLALIAAPAMLPPAGTPCYDETVVAPGAVFKATVSDPAGTVLYAFPFQIQAVPLSRAFVIANDANLFPQNITATTTIASLQAAIAGFATGAAIDGVIKYNYTLSSVYGAVIDNCGVGLSDATNAVILQAEQSAVGQPTTCTFTTAGLNFGSLAKPAAAFSTAVGNWKYVGVQVLGNQAGSSLPY